MSSSSSSCKAAQQPSWRERHREPDDPPAVDVPHMKATLEAAQRLADALVEMSGKALGRSLAKEEEEEEEEEEEKKKKAAAMVLVKEHMGDEQEAACGRRPRLEERLAPTTAIQPPGEAAPAQATAAAVEEKQGGRKSARQASRALTGKRPAWAALMAGSGEASWWSDDEEEEEEDGGKTKSKKRRRPASEVAAVKPRVVGRAPVQVFRGVLPKAAIDRLLKGETSTEGPRNPWPGIQAMLRGFMQCAFASSFTHPYIAEASSRCDGAGPPQRLDLLLTPSGARALLTPPAVAAIEAIVFGLKRALQFTGKVAWDCHLVLVLPGAPEQRFHVDSGRSWFYFTLLMPLTKDPPSAGRTEFSQKEDQPLVSVGVGDCLCFDGRRRHRGQGNNARSHVRVFLYIAVYSGTDYN